MVRGALCEMNLLPEKNDKVADDDFAEGGRAQRTI